MTLSCLPCSELDATHVFSCRHTPDQTRLPFVSMSLYVSHREFLGFPSQGQRWHLGSEPFGRPWQSGDVVGCMIDLTENTIIFTLNGEVLMSDSGSETAFREIEIGDGESRRLSLHLFLV